MYVCTIVIVCGSLTKNCCILQNVVQLFFCSVLWLGSPPYSQESGSISLHCEMLHVNEISAKAPECWCVILPVLNLKS